MSWSSVVFRFRVTLFTVARHGIWTDRSWTKSTWPLVGLRWTSFVMHILWVLGKLLYASGTLGHPSKNNEMSRCLWGTFTPQPNECRKMTVVYHSIIVLCPGYLFQPVVQWAWAWIGGQGECGVFGLFCATSLGNVRARVQCKSRSRRILIEHGEGDDDLWINFGVLITCFVIYGLNLSCRWKEENIMNSWESRAVQDLSLSQDRHPSTSPFNGPMV